MERHADESARAAREPERGTDLPEPPAALPADREHEDELVDEAAAESFPASDAPGWSPMHVGAPALRAWPVEHGHELRGRLRVDLERLALAGRSEWSAETAAMAEREEVGARALLEAGCVVVREPVGRGARVHNVESELAGADQGSACVVLGSRYDSEDDTRVAVLLAVVRALQSSRLRRPVRFALVAGAPGAACYAQRLRAGGATIHAALSLGTLGMARERAARVFFEGDRRGWSLARAASRAFRGVSRIPAHTLWTPDWAAWLAGDPGLPDRRRMRRDGWPAMTVSDHVPWDRRGAAPPDVDRMAAIVPGLVAVVERLAGGRG